MAKIRSISGARLSATTIFVKRPQTIRYRPFWIRQGEGHWRRWNCGRSSWARTIGPATSCGKNATNRKKSRKDFAGASRPR